ncbi:MAG TPA: hypothetical protein VF652_02295 [Allosphingosinicella sp.]|jgi:hypothetical protein
MRRIALLPALALVAACGTGAGPNSNDQAAQRQIENAQPIECSDCGPPSYGPDGKIIPQG